MRSGFRLIVTFLGLVLGTGILSPLVQANWQAWAQKTGNDQYLVQYAGAAMLALAEIARSQWFVFAAGFFIGGAICLWIDRLLRNGANQTITAKPARTAADIAHTLSPVGGSAVLFGYDKTKKTTEVGFELENTSGVPLRWKLEEFSWSIDGHNNANIGGAGASGVASIGGHQKIYGGIVRYLPSPRKPAKAVAKIIYQYGLATPPDTPMLREKVYAVEIDVNPNGAFRYSVLEENDAEI